MDAAATHTTARLTIDLSKVIRLRSMLDVLRSEVRTIATDEASLKRLASVHNEIESQLALAVPNDLRAELADLSSCCASSNPSKPEIRVAQAQLLGWIEGLLNGVQMTIGLSGRGQPAAAAVEEEEAAAADVDSDRFGSGTYL